MFGLASRRIKIVVGFARQVEPGGARRIAVADAVEPALEAIDARGIAVGVLIAVIAVVPVEDVEAAVGADFLRHRHEPDVVGGQEIGLGAGDVGRAVAGQHVAVDAAAVDIARVEPIAILLGVGIAVESRRAHNRRSSGGRDR